VEHFAINIGRQIGSGGREIGKKIAEKLGISYFDKELITIAAQESGISKEVFEKVDEVSTFSIVDGIMNLGNINNLSFNETLFKIQSDVILDLAKKNDCVFVGRCADYVLRENPNCVNIFICDNIESRINRIVNFYKLTTENKVNDFIQKVDRKRTAYYNYYTNKEWGVASSYHLCVNSSTLGEEKSVEFIVEYAKQKLNLPNKRK